MVNRESIVQRFQTFSIYELLVFIFLFVALFFAIVTNNIYNKTEDPYALKLYMVSISLLVMGLLSWIAYNNLGEKISYRTIRPNKIVPATLILLGGWFLAYALVQAGLYEVMISSIIPHHKLLQILGQLASLYLIMYALIENFIFTVVIPLIIIEKGLGVPYEKATIRHYIIASLAAGIAASLFHIAWKPLPQLITSAIYFSSWALANLVLRSSILSDLMHMLGNVLGFFYMTISPEYIIWR